MRLKATISFRAPTRRTLRPSQTLLRSVGFELLLRISSCATLSSPVFAQTAVRTSSDTERCSAEAAAAAPISCACEADWISPAPAKDVEMAAHNPRANIQCLRLAGTEDRSSPAAGP